MGQFHRNYAQGFPATFPDEEQGGDRRVPREPARHERGEPAALVRAADVEERRPQIAERRDKPDEAERRAAATDLREIT